jgi:hypothetical protein
VCTPGGRGISLHAPAFFKVFFWLTLARSESLSQTKEGRAPSPGPHVGRRPPDVSREDGRAHRDGDGTPDFGGGPIFKFVRSCTHPPEGRSAAGSEQTRMAYSRPAADSHAEKSGRGARCALCTPAEAPARPEHRWERADARDVERAAREHPMRVRCAAGAEGAMAQRAWRISAPFISLFYI